MDNNYVNSQDIPLGFGMLLAQNQEAMVQFAAFSPMQKQAALEGARTIRTKAEMREYVNQLTRGPL